ncbi:hypothetical protein QJS10_CPA09g00975 [Acorus calamus]|uniref:DUF4283 domain-containing protein n=1 Tax=Acorus calamus TaxID=4465 RepID=A0AAV9E5R9_ACOCL|nr:hypothetical protein QJS10_CPA09g00975 [Acorus calamus]
MLAPPDRGKGLLPLPSSETPLPFAPSAEAISPVAFQTKPSSPSTLPLKELADFPPLPSSKSSTAPSLYVAAPKVAQAKGILPSPASSLRVCEEEKTWSSFFKAPASKRPSTSIDYFVPTIDGPQKIAVLEEEEVAEAEAAWGNILVGYIWGKTPVFTPFLQFIKRLWRPKGELTLSLQGNGFFMVRFDLEEDLSHVLEDGPWSMDNRPFVIQRWNRNIRLERERLNSIPLWIKFLNLPLHFWSPTCIGKIASLIGSPLYLDSPTAMRTRFCICSLCIEVEAGSKLPDEVFVEIWNGDREAIKRRTLIATEIQTSVAQRRREKHKSVKGKACIKVDLQKAFDSVSWTYLEEENHSGRGRSHTERWEAVAGRRGKKLHYYSGGETGVSWLCNV